MPRRPEESDYYAGLGIYFTDLERALIVRAVNTERNNLAKWHGRQANGRRVSMYDGTVLFDPSFQRQIDALNSVERKLEHATAR